MPEGDNGDKKREKRGEALRGRLGGPSKTTETSEESETSKRKETTEIDEREDSGTESKSAETSEMSGTTESTEMEETTEGAESEETIRDRKNVNMYLPESDVQEMQIRFDELNARHRRVHGRAMEKNRDYYPALIRTALNDTSLEEELGLADSDE